MPEELLHRIAEAFAGAVANGDLREADAWLAAAFDGVEPLAAAFDAWVEGFALAFCEGDYDLGEWWAAQAFLRRRRDAARAARAEAWGGGID